MKLLILESPNKAKVISKYIQSEYGMSEWKVIATNGHFKNLKKNTFAIKKVDGSYIGDFVIENKSVYSELKKNINIAEFIYIATDDDREGEAIANDIVETFSIKSNRYSRVVFLEITKEKIAEILFSGQYDNGKINKNLVDARYARRLIDRIVGYKITSLVRRELKNDKDLEVKGIGNVSFASLSIIAQREKEINMFDSYYYKKIGVTYWPDSDQMNSSSEEIFLIGERKYIDGIDNDDFLNDMKKLRKFPHIITEFELDYDVDIQPPKPVIYSSLISNIFYLYKYDSKTTADIAQKLFEGVNINGTVVGLITYHRTDSYRLSEEIAQDAFSMIPYMILDPEDGPLGYDYLAPSQREYKNKKGAQDAHEAIRPTHMNVEFSPHNIRKYLSDEEFRVYDYIYKITLCSFMANSTYIETKIKTNCDGIVLKSVTKKQIFDGWESIGKYYVPFFKKYEKISNFIPDLYINNELRVKSIDDWSRKSKQPERYSEGRFIETITNKGIGRPSTIPTIVPDLLNKKYIKKNTGMLSSLYLGDVLVAWAEKNSPWIVDVEHARNLEEKLSKVEDGEFDKNELIMEYDNMLDDLLKEHKFHYIEDYSSEPPTEAQIAFLKKISNRGVDVPDDAFSFMAKASKIIKTYQESTRVCRCRFCKEGYIQEYDKYFKCSNRNCDFIFWKNSIESFMKNFNLNFDHSEYAINLLKKQKVLVENLEGKNVLFNADTFIEKDSNYGYTIRFLVKKKKT